MQNAFERFNSIWLISLISLPFQVVFSLKKHTTSCNFLKVTVTSPNVGDVVLVKDNVPRSWKLGKIVSREQR